MFGDFIKGAAFGLVLALAAGIWFLVKRVYSKLTLKYKEASKAGRLAYANSLSQNENPHPINSLLNKSWNHGYHKAETARRKLLEKQM